MCLMAAMLQKTIPYCEEEEEQPMQEEQRMKMEQTTNEEEPDVSMPVDVAGRLQQCFNQKGNIAPGFHHGGTFLPSIPASIQPCSNHVFKVHNGQHEDDSGFHH